MCVYVIYLKIISLSIYIYIAFHVRIVSILVYFGNLYPLDPKNRRYPPARLQLCCTPGMAIERDAHCRKFLVMAG